MRHSTRALLAVSLSLPLALVATVPSAAAGKKSRDTTPPVVSVTSPTSGSTTGSQVTATGTASDNRGLRVIAAQLDGAGWYTAIGTTSWSVPLSGLAAGGHNLFVLATDIAGNTSSRSVSFTVQATTATSPTPTPTPTSSPSPAPAPTATTTPAPTESPAPTSTSSTSTAPSTQGTWTSPEGVRIVVGSAGPWTIAGVYTMLKQNALHLDLIGRSLTVNVQDTYASQATISASESGGTYYGFQAIMYLKGVSSTFSIKPDAQLAHEYGHVWTHYWSYLNQGGGWSPYLTKRWSSADGNVTLATDSRTNSNYTWAVSEIAADDYRLLFGSSAAISQSPASLNTSIVAPTAQPGLREWFLSTWA